MTAYARSLRWPRLCVGMATYDDFDGAWFTIQAIGMYQAEVFADVSFLVIDNHPEGPAGPALRALEGWLPRYRYVPFGGYRGTAVRDLVFREARADIVCCLDSHVLLQPGALAHLLDWFSAHPGSRDLLQGPLLHDDLKPGGFGGEEGYLQEKFRQRGGRVLCHPQLGWLMAAAHTRIHPTSSGGSSTWSPVPVPGASTGGWPDGARRSMRRRAVATGTCSSSTPPPRPAA